MNKTSRVIIQEGFALLKSKKNYKQVTVVNKLKFLNFFISEPSFSNILNGKQVGNDVLWDAAQGIQKLIEHELGFHWEGAQYVENKEADWKPMIVAELLINEPSIILKPGFAFHQDGRLSISKKVDFLSVAQKEIIEFGVSLQTFTSYFFSRNDQEFKNHVKVLLEKGINFKCFLIDPNCNEAILYFRDRGREQDDDMKDIATIKDSILKLGKIQKEFMEEGYPGTFEIFTYQHIPYNYFMVVDGSTPNGRMIISHYIYGESRANCPVLEFSRKENLLLYKKYERALQGLTRGAKAIIF